MVRCTPRLAILCAVLVFGVVAQAASVSPALSSRDFGSLALNAGSPASAILSFQIAGASSTPSFTLRYRTDFSLGQPNCTAGSCTVPVTFTPGYPGVRVDAVLVRDGGPNGPLLATTLLHGIGLAPQAVLRPGVMSGFAGTGVLGSSGDHGFANNAQLSNPQGLAIDGAGNVYIADSLAQVIRKVGADGIITTVPGLADLNTPTGVAVDGAGNLYIADAGNNRVLKLDAVSGAVTTIVDTILNNPTDLAVDPAGNLYIADQYNNRIRRVDAGTGAITTVAGGGAPQPGTDGIGNGGLAINATLLGPSSVALDSAGNLYIADSGNNLIRQVKNGIISVVAGNGNPGSGGDGEAAILASLNQPASVRVDAAGNLYIVDSHNNAVRQVNGAGIISTISSSQLNNPAGIAGDPSGSLYIADQGNNRVWKLAPGPTALNFPTTPVGDLSLPKTVSIANIGNQALAISSFILSGAFQQQSSGETDCLSNITVTAASACSVSVVFAPSAASSLTGTLSLLTNALNNAATVPISLNGTGTGGGIPDPTVTPLSLSFGNQPARSTSPSKTVTLTNSASVSLNLTGISMSGSDFFVAGTTCQSPLTPNNSCTVSVTFTPRAAGPRSGTLVMTESTGTIQFSQSVFLSGVGVIAPPVLSPSTLAFSNGGIAGSLPMTQTVTLTNPNAVPLDIFSVALSRPDLFRMTTTCPASLAANSSCTVAVTFTPSTSAVDPASLTFTFQSASSQTVTLTSANPVLTFAGSPSSLGPQTRNLRSVPVSYVLRNLSAGGVAVSSIAIAGTNASDFAQVNNCGTSIAAGQGCTIWLTYTPTGNSPVCSSANIVVTDSAPGSPHSIAVSGTATGLSQAIINIDSPPSGKSVSGLISLSGWAISNNLAITAVTLTVDGKPLGPATYGARRTDVCTVYPSRASCPNVGWSLPFDTRTLADGVHSLIVSASSASGNTTLATSFTVANWTGGVIAPSSAPSIIAVDAPNAAAALKGAASFSGWAIDNNEAITAVTLAVDGVAQGAAQYGTNRPDVCRVYPGRAGCPYVGWNLALDTRQFSNGSHTLAVTAQTTSGNFTTVATPFQVSNPAPSTITAWIDAPGSVPVSGMYLAAGWAIDSSTAVTGVNLSIDGVPQGAASSNSRPDVCRVYNNPQGCPNVGWNKNIDTTKLADGPHTLGLLIANSNGQELNLSKQFTVSNLKNYSVKTTLVNIGLPGSTSGPLSGVAQFVGWAVDQVTPIATVALAIDGVPFSYIQSLVPRPDVCLVYPASAGCPLVGWAASFDTTSLADGQHVLQVTATSQQGMRSTTSATFTSSNGAQTASQGKFVAIDFPSVGSTISGTINMAGWAVNTNNPIQKVVITLDGVAAGTAQYGTPRPDVCSYASLRGPDCPNVGWFYTLDTTYLPNGIHTLGAIEYGSNGAATISSSVLVSNAPRTMTISIGSPVSNGTYNGTMTLAGWAIDDASAVQSVTVSIDGQPIAPAQYGGSRPDVCAVFPGRAGCPNVGWSLPLDTTAFANGAHTLQISGLSSKNVRFTQSVPFSIGN